MIAPSFFRTMKLFSTAATRPGPPVRFAPLLALCACLATVGGAHANGFGENGAWQFQTQQDRVHKGTVLDMIERKKAGYYDAMRPNYNYTTYIDHQVNCTVSANTTGNTGSNATTASTSSPTVTSSGATNSSTSANSATNGQAQSGLSGILVSDSGLIPSGAVENAQSNTGALNSSVSGSPTSSTTGPVSTGGTSEQVLNSQQTSSGTLTASISGSTACVGPLNGN